MRGMKKKLTSAKTANDPNSRINKSLRHGSADMYNQGFVPSYAFGNQQGPGSMFGGQQQPGMGSMKNDPTGKSLSGLVYRLDQADVQPRGHLLIRPSGFRPDSATASSEVHMNSPIRIIKDKI
jgi:hypothetical protein